MAKPKPHPPWITQLYFDKWPVSYSCTKCGQSTLVPTNGKYPVPDVVADAFLASFQAAHANCNPNQQPLDLPHNPDEDD